MIGIPPRGYLFIGLNGIRALSILTLLLVFASNVVILADDIKAVKNGGGNKMVTIDDVEYECDYIENSTIPNQAAGLFWAIINRLFVIFLTALLVLAEIEWPIKFFENYFPVLGPNFGVGILGAIQWILAASILSHHISTFPLVSAFMLFSVGCLNVLLGLVYKHKIKDMRSIRTFKDMKAKELLPSTAQKVVPDNFKPLNMTVGSIFTRSEKEEMSQHSTGGSFGGHGFGRQGEKIAALNGAFISRPVESLPRYAPKVPLSTRSGSRQESYDKEEEAYDERRQYDSQPSSRASSPGPDEMGRRQQIHRSPSRI